MSRYNRYPVSGMTNVHKNIYRNGSNSIPRYYYIPVYRPPLFGTHVCVSSFGLRVVCAHIPNGVGGRERCTHADTDINKEIHAPLNILAYVYIRI